MRQRYLILPLLVLKFLICDSHVTVQQLKFGQPSNDINCDSNELIQIGLRAGSLQQPEQINNLNPFIYTTNSPASPNPQYPVYPTTFYNFYHRNHNLEPRFITPTVYSYVNPHTGDFHPHLPPQNPPYGGNVPIPSFRRTSTDHTMNNPEYEDRDSIDETENDNSETEYVDKDVIIYQQAPDDEQPVDKYQIRTPAIKHDFYDIEEKIIIRPVGSAIIQLQSTIQKQDEASGNPTKVDNRKFKNKYPCEPNALTSTPSTPIEDYPSTTQSNKYDYDENRGGLADDDNINSHDEVDNDNDKFDYDDVTDNVADNYDHIQDDSDFNSTDFVDIVYAKSSGHNKTYNITNNRNDFKSTRVHYTSSDPEPNLFLYEIPIRGDVPHHPNTVKMEQPNQFFHELPKSYYIDIKRPNHVINQDGQQKKYLRFYSNSAFDDNDMVHGKNNQNIKLSQNLSNDTNVLEAKVVSVTPSDDNQFGIREHTKTRRIIIATPTETIQNIKPNQIIKDEDIDEDDSTKSVYKYRRY